MGTLTKLYVGAIVAAGSFVLWQSLFHWHAHEPLRFAVYLLIAWLGSGMKVVLPSFNGTMSLHFLFVLVGISEFGLAETLLMGCLGIVIQSLWHATTRIRLVQVAFNVASVALSVAAANAVY